VPLLCLWSLVLHVPSSHAAAGTEVNEITLQLGQQMSLSAAGVKSYSAGVSGVVEVRLSKEGDQFVLVALKPGNTTLLMFMLDGREVLHRIQVVADDAAQGEPIRVTPKDNIRLDLYFVQVSQDEGHQLGVAYPDSVGGTATLSADLNLLSGRLTDASLGIADQVLPRLDLAQRSGWARVSRQAAVVAENGRQAEFRSGGEVNVPIQGALTAEVRSISFGSQVTVEPRFDRDTGRIELHVGAEVADLTSDSGTGIPGRQLAKLDTVVNLDLGKSLVLAGLNSARESRGTRGLPGLSRIPILGALFGSRTRSSEETKNLLFIVPTVVQAVPLSERNLVEEMLRVYQGFRGDTKDVKLLEPQPRHSAAKPALSAFELYDAGTRYLAASDLVRAEQYLASALGQGFDERSCVRALLEATVRGSRFRSALSYAEPALVQHPGDRTLRQLVAAIHLVLGELPAAEQELRRLLASEDTQPEPHYLFALVLTRRGINPAERHQAWRRYLELAPTGRHAEEARAALLEGEPASVETLPEAS
jgi:pilus assembly protein CpaC